MFAKLLVVILSVGVIASALLVIRQQRINTFHDISVIHEKMIDHERVLWKLRNDIANRCRPAEVRMALAQLNESWDPIPARPELILPGVPNDGTRMANGAISPTPSAPEPDAQHGQRGYIASTQGEHR
ncbi:MAG TPA: hypothetical protein VG711_00080 [Phycisphaerales bacterium]|nr:hypothetical protein [Phycisphaerales bacterium]